ncbi:MAG TPA: hypothetical protein VFB34_03250, partial [Chloroflexota bacterium]|nr:hypothetical protein [Chloroflexota bacterium]
LGIVGFVCQGTSWMVFHEARRRWPDAAVMLTDGFGRRFGQEPASTIGDRIEALGGSPAVLIPQGVGEFRSSPLLLIAAGDHSPPVGAGGSEVDSLIRTLVGTEVQDVTVMESPVLVRRLDSGIDVESVEIRRENGEVRVAAVVNVKKPPKL